MPKKYKFSYAKLVRDKVPEMIKKDGGLLKKRILDSAGYIQELKKKFLEESRELIAAENKKETLEELADLQEIIDHLLKALRLTKTELKAKQLAKRRRVGGFKKRIYIDHVATGDKFDPEWLKYFLKNRRKFPLLK